MGKGRHSKDRNFITATEWATQYGGKKDRTNSTSRPLPFDRCAISLSEYTTPVCLKEGVIFDLESLMEYLLKHKKNPITGELASVRDIIRLNMSKSDDGYWMCPITNKALTNYSHVVAIKTTGNVYAYEAVSELNLKTKSYKDLITGEPFERSDIITLQDPDDDEHVALRDINNFVHLQTLREDTIQAQKSESKIRLNPTAEKVMKEIEAKAAEASSSTSTKKTLEDYVNEIYDDKGFKDDVEEFLKMSPTIDDVNPGQINTDGKASSSLTSTVMQSNTSNATRLATPEEIRDALCKKIRGLGKKGYVQIQTTIGNLNLELHCDITPRTAWNFILLCNRGYYNDTIIHRLIPGFMVQGGDPTGTGRGGESAWKVPFRDEFDTRVLHDKRGILSMANSGSNTNGSQFFITFAATKHLDLRHTVFGRLVGGGATLDRIEAIGSDSKENPLTEIKILKAEVFTNPIDEAMLQLKDFIKTNQAQRLTRTQQLALPKQSNTLLLSADASGVGVKRMRESETKIDSTVKARAIGKYIPATNAASATKQTSQQNDKVAAFLKSQNNISSW